jgi:hypothetical protein
VVRPEQLCPLVERGVDRQAQGFDSQLRVLQFDRDLLLLSTRRPALALAESGGVGLLVASLRRRSLASRRSPACLASASS